MRALVKQAGYWEGWYAFKFAPLSVGMLKHTH